MPPAPIGRPASRQLTRPVTVTNGTIPVNNFSDSNLIRPKNEYGGSSQSLGTFVTVDNGFSNQYEKWSMGLEPASGLQLAESPDLELEKVCLRTSSFLFGFKKSCSEKRTGPWGAHFSMALSNMVKFCIGVLPHCAVQKFSP